MPTFSPTPLGVSGSALRCLAGAPVGEFAIGKAVDGTSEGATLLMSPAVTVGT